MLSSLWRSIHDPVFRRDLLWRRLPRPAGVFQISGDTGEDRFPAIFRFVRDALGEGELRLLSFGCSTGEEVFTLRRYFPLAAIDGIDINPYRIKTCRSRLRRQGGDPQLSFSVAGSSDHLPDASYDAIFCLAVLRHGGLAEGPAPRCDHLIRFEDAERITADFARCLKPGGFLAIVSSNFRFADMAAGALFKVVMRQPANWRPGLLPLYDRHNRLLPGAVYRDAVFQRRAEMDPFGA